jgi:hydroxylaminobenzene mutase
MFLFLVGLLTGLIEPQFRNVRMGLAAHLEGVMNGTFLIAIGAVWGQIRMSPVKKALAFWTVLYGTYGNCVFTTLAAVFGTASLSPITGPGHNAELWQENIVKFGFLSVGISIITSSVLMLWGLRRKAVV